MLPLVLVAAALLGVSFFGVQFSVREYLALFVAQAALPAPFTSLLDPPARPSLAAATTTITGVFPIRVLAVSNGTLTPLVKVTASSESGPLAGGVEVPGISLWLLLVACLVSFLLGALFAVASNSRTAPPSPGSSGDGGSKPVLEIGELVLAEALPSPLPTDLQNQSQFVDMHTDSAIEIVTLTDEINLLSNQVAVLTAENESLVVQDSKTIVDASKRVERANRCMDLAMQAAREHAKENEKLKKFQELYGTLPEQVEAAKQQFKELGFKHEKLERENQSFTLETTRLAKQVEQWKERLREAQDTYDTRPLKEEKERVRGELRDIEREKSSLQVKYEQERCKLQAENDQERSRLQAENEQEKSRLQGENQEQKSELRAQYEQEKTELQAQYEREKSELQARYDQLEVGMKEQFEAAKSELKSKYDECELDTQKKTETMKSELKSKYDELELNMQKDMEAKKQALEDENRRLAESKMALEDTNSRLTETKNHLETEIKQMRSVKRANMVAESKEILMERFKVVKEERDILENKLKDIEGELDDMNKERRSLKKEVIDLINETADLEHDVDDLEEEKKQLKQQKRDLVKDIADLKEICGGIMAKVRNDFGEEFENLQGAVSHLLSIYNMFSDGTVVLASAPENQASGGVDEAPPEPAIDPALLGDDAAINPPPVADDAAIDPALLGDGAAIDGSFQLTCMQCGLPADYIDLDTCLCEMCTELTRAWNECSET